MKSTERLVYFFDLEVTTNKDEASPPPMTDVIDALVECHRDKLALHSVNNDALVLQIAAIEIDQKEEHALLLLKASDKNAPDVTYSNPEKESEREIKKVDGEGRSFAAHMLVSLVEEPGTPNTYLCLLERNTGLYRSHAVRLLQAVLRSRYQRKPSAFSCAAKSGAKDKSGRPKSINYRPMIDLTGHPSDDFVADIEEGELKEIVLVHNEKQGQLGSKSWLVKETSTLKVKPTASTPVHNRWAAVKAALSENRKDYERARIRFKTPAGENVGVEVDTASGNLMIDDRYVKMRRISNLNPPMGESTKIVVPHFKQKLVMLLKAHRKPN